MNPVNPGFTCTNNCPIAQSHTVHPPLPLCSSETLDIVQPMLVTQSKSMYRPTRSSIPFATFDGIGLASRLWHGSNFTEINPRSISQPAIHSISQLPHRRDSLTCDLLQSSGILACGRGVGGALNETSLPARSPRGVKFFSPVVAYRDVQGSIFTRSINFQGSFNLRNLHACSCPLSCYTRRE